MIDDIIGDESIDENERKVREIKQNNLNDSVHKYSKEVKEFLNIFESSEFDFIWLDWLLEWNCWKCILIYRRKETIYICILN